MLLFLQLQFFEIFAQDDEEGEASTREPWEERQTITVKEGFSITYWTTREGLDFYLNYIIVLEDSAVSNAGSTHTRICMEIAVPG